MVFTRRSNVFWRVGGGFTLLMAIGMVLVSYATAAGWMHPAVLNETTGSTATEEAASDADVDVPPRSPMTATQQVGMLPPMRAGDNPDGAGPVGVADGYIPDGEALSPWDNGHPAVANLDPDLRSAVQQAAIDAEAEGIVMVINSGWRSKRYQQTLLDEAVVTYGSEEEARKWVNSPDASTHVTGDGVDIGYTDADYWLIEHGGEYGLCQTYENEIWHFELAVEPGEACPPPLRDATTSVPENTFADSGVASTGG